MRNRCVLMVLIVAAGLLPAAYDSALAPYPHLQTKPFDPDVERLLAAIESNAALSGAGFSATVEWRCESSRSLEDSNNDRYGPFSLKSSWNWHGPPTEGFWKAGVFSIALSGPDFRIEKPADDQAPPDWWLKDGETIYTRKYSADWPTVYRFHHDALESDMIGYGEGLGLILWAFQPAEYLRRAETLARGPDRRFDRKTYPTLVATPAWIAFARFLENRTHYPFTDSTMSSWAEQKPVITYFVDPELGAITGAEFAYYRCFRDSPKDWKPVPKPSGLVIRSFVREFARTPAGAAFPLAIDAEVIDGPDVVRRISLTMKPNGPVAALPSPPLPEDKRMVDPWPLYQPEYYEARIASGDTNHANLLGRARALCFEGRLPAAEEAVFAAVEALDEDLSLAPETYGGIDWELGFAVYELLWRYDDPALKRLWDRLPRTTTWVVIAARAVGLYQEFRGEDSERITDLLETFEANFEVAKRVRIEEAALEQYRANLREDFDKALGRGDSELSGYFEGLLRETASGISR